MKFGASSPLGRLVIGECTNAPFAAKSSLFFDGDSRSQEDAVSAHFPPCPESFFQDLLISPCLFYSDPFLTTIHLGWPFSLDRAVFWPEYFAPSWGLNSGPRIQSGTFHRLGHFILGELGNAPLAPDPALFLAPPPRPLRGRSGRLFRRARRVLLAILKTAIFWPKG